MDGTLHRLALVVGAALAMSFPGAAAPATPGAAPADTPPAAAAPAVAAPLDELGRGTPRGTLNGFLEATTRGDYRHAAGYLNLRRLLASQAAEQGPELARKLRVVLDHTKIDADLVPDTPEGRPEAGVAKARQLVGRVVTDTQAVSITLEREPRDDGALIWQFSADTVTHVPDLYWMFSYGIVGQWLPPVLVETRVLGLALWQWIGLVVLIAGSILVAHAVVRPGMPVTRWVLARWRIMEVSPTFDRGVAPIRVLIALAIFRAAQPLLALPVSALALVSIVQKFLLIATVVWLVARFVEGLGTIARRRLLARSEIATLPMVDFAQRTAKIVLAIMAALVLLQAVGVQIGALITAVGVGGIGLALAAQRIVENLFSGLVLMGDQPVRVGDFCRFGPHEGTVERIGLWSTRVRTLGRTVVSVPNAQFLSLQVENLQRRDRILFETTLRLRYETTPDQLRWIVVRIREMLYSHPRVDPDPARVRLARFGQVSLEVEVFAYVLTTDFEDFVAQREDLSLRIMDIVAAAGTCFALPGQINYGEADRLDPDRGAAVAAEVERWRREARLPLPEFPPEQIQALRTAARRNSG